MHAGAFWSYHRRLVDAVGVWLGEVKMPSQVLLLHWTEANRSPERSAASSHPPTPSSPHKPLLRITVLFFFFFFFFFVIYEQIALQSTLWIYADSSWDQFNSGWGGWGEKKRKKKKKKPWLPLSHYMVNLQRMRRRHASQQKAPDLWKAAIYMHMVSVS